MKHFFGKVFEALLITISFPVVLILLFLFGLLPDKANNVVIVGTKRSGKTTLWKDLGGIKTVKPNTSTDRIESFVVTRKNGTKVTVSETYDMGGENEYVASYGSIIDKDDTFIYYLVDSNEVKDPSKMTRIRSDLLKIDKIVKEKGFEKIGFKFILTHFYDYVEKNPGSSEYDLYRQFSKGLEKSKGRGVIGSRLSDANYNRIMMVAELDEKKAKKLGKDYIDIIKNEIGG